MVKKVLGQVAPADTNNADLYTVPGGKSAVVSSLVVGNITAADATFRIAVRIAGEVVGNKNWLYYDETCPANKTFPISIGITLAATDVVTVRSGTANTLAFHAYGDES